MKNNVITRALMVPFSTDGSLEIIGKEESFDRGSSVVFLAKGNEVVWLSHARPNFCKECIITRTADGSGTDMLIFKYSFRGELRNPQKLLKSVRNKLMRAIHVENRKFETGYYEEYEQPYLSSHSV